FRLSRRLQNGANKIRATSLKQSEPQQGRETWPLKNLVIERTVVLLSNHGKTLEHSSPRPDGAATYSRCAGHRLRHKDSRACELSVETGSATRKKKYSPAAAFSLRRPSNSTTGPVKFA